MNLNVISDPPARKPSVAAPLALNTTQNAINSAQRASAFSEVSQVEGGRTPLSAKPVKEPTAKSGFAKRSLLNHYVGSILKRPPLSARLIVENLLGF
jgi:hypothetical protein